MHLPFNEKADRKVPIHLYQNSRRDYCATKRPDILRESDTVFLRWVVQTKSLWINYLILLSLVSITTENMAKKIKDDLIKI
jgi:hypothetical protein